VPSYNPQTGPKANRSEPLMGELMAKHPHLLTTPQGIERARRLVGHERWARDLRDRLVAEAGTLAEHPLPVFETEWWQTARQKPWIDTYVEIHHHCNEVPLPLMHAAYRAAIAYALTGDDRIAQDVVRVLRHYTAYSFEFQHPDVGMVYGIWGLMALRAYDLVYDQVPDADRPALDAALQQS